MANSELPYAADAEVSLSYDELEVCLFVTWLRQTYASPQVLQLQYEKELAKAHVSVQTKFNFAWGLVKSPMRQHQVDGVTLLQGLLSMVTLRTCPITILARYFPYTAGPA